MYMPTRPLNVNERIKNAIKGKVPHFFQEAKNKTESNVESKNNSTVNRLRDIVPNKNIRFRDIAGEFDYKMLMNSEVEKIDNKIISLYRKLDRSKKWMIRGHENKNRQEGLLFVYKNIRDQLNELEKNEDKIVNHLIVELFENKKSPNKDTLWNCYGDIILSNLRENLKGTKQCESCGVRIKVEAKNNKYCEQCSIEISKMKNAERVRKFRNKM